jgi:hypothetical protein
MSVTARRPFGRAAALTAALALLVPVLAVVVSLPQPAALAGVSTPPCAIDGANGELFEPEAPEEADNRYVIASEGNLVFLSVNFNAFVSGGSEPRWRELDFVQTEDLDLSGCLFTPIGGGNSFSGSYDGGGKIISGLTIKPPAGSEPVGMFSETTSSAELENIRLVAVIVEGNLGEVGEVGGLVGLNRGSIKNSSVTGTVVGKDKVGGLVGLNRGSIKNSSVTGTVDGTERVGGLVGQNSNGTIEDSHATASVTATDQVGGLVGENFAGGGTAIIRDSYATGAVSGDDNVGGLVGWNLGVEDGTASIVNSYATGAVSGDDNVGGLVGWNLGVEDGTASIVNSYATGAVSGDDNVGGLVGLNEVDDGLAMIQRTYSTGSVTATEGGAVGGLIGKNDGGTVEDSFWDIGTSGQTDSDGGTGKSTAEMKLLATFAHTATEGLDAAWLISAGWKLFEDGESVWGICSAVNQGYPFLLWQFTSDPCSAQVVESASTLSLSCEGPVAVGATVVCTVTGGEPGIEILWRAAYNPPFAGAGVTLDAAGAGTFSFTLPAAALGQELTVELVAWLAPASLGVVGGPVPASVPAGEAPFVPARLLAFGLLAVAGAVLAVRRQVVAG